jgi:hypothetical protein
MVVFDLDAVIITRELCVGIFDEIDCFIVLFSNGGLPKVAFEIKPPTGEAWGYQGNSSSPNQRFSAPQFKF